MIVYTPKGPYTLGPKYCSPDIKRKKKKKKKRTCYLLKTYAQDLHKKIEAKRLDFSSKGQAQASPTSFSSVRASSAGAPSGASLAGTVSGASVSLAE